MSKIQNASEPWAGHSFTEVECYVKEQLGLYGAELVDLGLPSGTKWADRNIGADSPEAPGQYFMWGDTEGAYSTEGPYCGGNYDSNKGGWFSGTYSACKGSKLSYYSSNPVMPLAYDAARKKMGVPWRMPTHTEFEELVNNCTYTWTTQNGVAGALFTSNVNGNNIFFPAAGRILSADLGNFGERGRYWSSTLYDNEIAYYLDFKGDGADPGCINVTRVAGFPVRAVQ